MTPGCVVFPFCCFGVPEVTPTHLKRVPWLSRGHGTGPRPTSRLAAVFFQVEPNRMSHDTKTSTRPWSPFSSKRTKRNEFIHDPERVGTFTSVQRRPTSGNGDRQRRKISAGTGENKIGGRETLKCSDSRADL